MRSAGFPGGDLVALPVNATGAQHQVFVDHYASLGISVAASLDEIKRCFRRLAKQHHPDLTGGDGFRFHEIYTAYRVLADPQARSLYNRQYRNYLLGLARRSQDLVPRIQVPATRLKFPGDIKSLAKLGLLRKRWSSRRRHYFLNIDYDIEVLLSRRELMSRIRVSVPVIARSVCPDCLGSDPDCYACYGRGSYKSSRTIHLDFEGGLTNGQIIEVNLRGLKPAPMSHYKRRRLRLKISELVKSA